jgi:hypothetical protein
MANWVDNYISKIYSSHKNHVLICDKDNLFAYDELISEISNNGYNVLIAHSDLDVRILYEIKLNGNSDKFLLVAPPKYFPLPDILNNVHFVEVGFSDLFPNLDAKAISGLSFNALCTLSSIKQYDILGHVSTLKFLLENLYGLDFNSLTKSFAKERILNSLITVFLERNGVNQPLINFLSSLAKPYLPKLVSLGLSKVNLLEFIQTNWSAFVADNYSVIDFSEPSLRKSIGNLFIQDLLKPVKVSKQQYENAPSSLKIGYTYDSAESDKLELDSIIEYLTNQVSIIQDLHEEWFMLIKVLSKAMTKSLSLNNKQYYENLSALNVTINNRFQRFIENSYWSTFTLSGNRKPIVVSRILDYIKSQPGRKKALIVIDGMNYWQWELISELFKSSNISFNARATMAFIPSITAWSRQSIFRGAKPDLKENNSKEEKLFRNYWLQNSYQDYQIHFSSFSAHAKVDFNTISSDKEMLGFVCNDLDEIMHGAVLGNDQLYSDTLQWITKSNFLDTINTLIQKGYKCYITSDHGNVESVGIKNLKLSEKVGSLSRGKRHIQFSNETVLNNFLQQNQNTNIGVRDCSVFLKDNSAFTSEQSVIITHGGSHLWEILIPFIEI